MQYENGNLAREFGIVTDETDRCMENLRREKTLVEVKNELALINAKSVNKDRNAEIGRLINKL